MALQFPTNPTNGQVYDEYVFSTATGAWERRSIIDDRIDGIEQKIISPIDLNANTINANYTIPAGYNGISAGPITIASGVTVTVPTGSAWSIV